MFGAVRRHLTFANVVSLIALFVALGGAAYALTIPKHSVGTRQLKRGAVISSKVQDHSLLAKDVKAGQLPAQQVVVRSDAKKISGGAFDSLSVSCDDGERAVGGGGGVTGFSDAGDGVVIDRPLVNGNIPNSGETPNGWTVAAYNAGGGESNFKTYVVCASR
jgi:hypothetical protein